VRGSRIRFRAQPGVARRGATVAALDTSLKGRSMMDTNNAEVIREILRLEFESASGWKRDDKLASKCLARLAETTADIPAALLDAYSELFEDYVDSEVETELRNSVGLSWFPEDATEYVKRFVAIRTGNQ
jgi:hypothetical protein